MNLEDVIDNAKELPNIPKVVQELIASFGDDDVDATEIAEKLSKDQTLSAKVLRMSNSVRYGGSKQVGSISDAVVMLGFNALRTLVLASGVHSAFKAPEGFDIKVFWHHSFTVGAISKWVAQFTDVDGEKAYTCGMLHNIGCILIHILLPEDAVKIDTLVSQGGNRRELEDNHYGFSYIDAGARLAQKWKFPDEVVEAMRQHAALSEGDDFSRLGAVVALASYIDNIHDAEDYDHMVENFPTDIASRLGIDAVELLSRIDETRELAEEIDSMLV
ncbi:MAG: HDOD domain-containing protein [Spongiibacteraceae bacterium]